MAQPSSSHHDRTERDRERHRSDRERSRHHHRTISSTTLLLVLSLVLAGLAIMLSLPRQYSNPDANPETAQGGVWGYLSPKRTQALISREAAVTLREAEVARREAELLIGAPGGVVPPPAVCSPCAATTIFETISPPVQTIIKEIVKEDGLVPPGWTSNRAEEVLDRELRIAERERDISKREESVNRREHDASRRESWIMEQLIALGNDGDSIEEEYVYEPKRKAKFHQLPAIETLFEPETKTVIQTQTITVPAPANTRRASPPEPQVVDPASPIVESPRTTAIEIVTEEDLVDGLKTVTVSRPRATRRPRGWFGGW